MNVSTAPSESTTSHSTAARSPHRPPWSRRSVAGAGLALVLTACGAAATATPPATGQPTGTVAAAGAASAGAAATPSTVAGSSNRAAAQAYRTCLTQHGVTLPTRPTQPPNATAPTGSGPATGNGGGFGGGLRAVIADPANKAAVDACRSLLPEGGFGNGGNAGGRGQALQAYFSCLTDNGVTVPTTVAGSPPPSIDRTTPAFAAANAKCRVLLPQRGTNSSTTTTVAGG